jgi:AraC-like DNA-binding protein/ligand-binding sensor protein
MDKTGLACFFVHMLESMHHTLHQKVSEIFDLYTELHGVRISLFGPEGRLIYPDAVGRPNCGHCSMLRETLNMDSLCRKLDRDMMRAAFDQKEMISYTCHAGMREATVPLIVDEMLVGYVMIGQFRSAAAPDIAPYASQWRAEQGNDELQQEFLMTPVFAEEKIDTLLSMFRHLLELIISGQLIHHKDYDLVQPVIDQIQANPHIPLSLDEAARMSGRSPSTVSRLFKKITGRSFKQYQVWYRLERASNLLQTMPNRPVTEIAQECGFDDPLYFSRTFRKHFGHSPTIHRSQKN